MAEFIGDGGDNELIGGPEDDTLVGDAGNDTLVGEGGNDSIDGGDDNDDLTGGPGNDSLIGGAGDDTLEGNAGEDDLSGGPGRDDLRGGIDNDTLSGGNQADTLRGAQGDDSLDGGNGADQLFGGDGQDTVNGGDGNDTIVVREGQGNDSVSGGEDTDTLTITGPGGVVPLGWTFALTTGSVVTDGPVVKELSAESAGTLTFADGTVITFDGIEAIDTVEAPTLTLAVDPAAFSENGGTATATVTRNTGTVGDLLVTLASDDESAATVPATVTILDGFDSATFTVTGVDDPLVDAAQTPTITAAAAGFGDATAVVTVENDDVATLSLSIDPAEISENGGTATATVIRNTGTTGDLLVTLASDDETEAVVPATVTILNGSDSATFTIDGVDDALADGDKTPTISATAIDFVAGAAAVTVTDDEVPTLALSLDTTAIAEGETATLTVTRNTETTGDLAVTLASDDESAATLPLSLTIPDGSDSATVTVDGVDDTQVDGAQAATLTASAAGFVDGTAALTVTDDDVPSLSVTVDPAEISENGGTATATVSRNTGTVGDVIVALASSDPSAATMPPTVTIPDGFDSASFTVTGVDNIADDGTRTPTIVASAAGFFDGTGTIAVTDNDIVGDDDGNELIGGEADETLIGAGGDDTLAGNGGNDLLRGNTNNDSLSGGAGNDTLRGGLGNDTLSGNADDDDLGGGGGNDQLGGGLGNDTLDGGDDDDEVRGGVGADSVEGGGGSDTLFGGEGEDTVSGNGGDDVIFVREGEGNDTVSGGNGDDTLVLVGPSGLPPVGWTLELVGDGQVRPRPDVTPLPDESAGTVTFADGTTITFDGIERIEAQTPPTLTLSFDASEISENGGTATGTVTRNTATDDSLFVSLTTGDFTEAAVPPLLLIPAGAASATFTVTAVDDGDLDGDQPTEIFVKSLGDAVPGFLGGSAEIIVTDDEVPALSLEIAAGAVSENVGTVSATVIRNTGTEGNLLVTLTSDDPSEATVIPPTAVIPDGFDQVTFAITVVDDTIADGSQTPKITASADGFAAGSDTLTVSDDELPALSLSIDPTSISENGGTATATVSRNTGTVGALEVTLVSSDPGEAAVPATVTIPDGAASATFTVIGVDDADIDGAQSATLTATAAGFQAAQDTLTVTDDDAAAPTNTLTLKVAGTPALGQNPLLNVYLDDDPAPVASAEVTANRKANETETLTFDIEGLDQAQKLRLEFANDAAGNGEDRNLWIFEAAIDGDPLDVREALYDRQSLPDIPGQPGLYWNGALEFPLQPVEGWTLEVVAAGRPAGGVAPLLEVYIDDVAEQGAPVASSSVTARRLAGEKETLTFAGLDLDGTQSLKLTFANDAVVNGEDRNLWIEEARLIGAGSPPIVLDVADAVYDRDPPLGDIPGQKGLFWNGGLVFDTDGLVG